MKFQEYVDGNIPLFDFIKFLSDEYYVDTFNGNVELLPFNNMQLVDIRNDGKFRIGKDNDLKLSNRIDADYVNRLNR